MVRTRVYTCTSGTVVFVPLVHVYSTRVPLVYVYVHVYVHVYVPVPVGTNGTRVRTYMLARIVVEIRAADIAVELEPQL
jgi:hypothetical protein